MKKYIPLGLSGAALLVIIILIMERWLSKREAQHALLDSELGKFNPGPYAEAVYLDVTKGSFVMGSDQPYLDALALSDDELRKVWYYWETKLKNKTGTFKGYSMRGAIDYAWYMSASTIDASNKLMAKLKGLNLK